MPEQIQFRRGTALSAAVSDPVLAEGEPGYEVDTGVLKIGDGVTTWTNLPALTEGVVGTYIPRSSFPAELGYAISDEVTNITTGVAKLTSRAPFAFTLTGVRATLSTASTAGLPTFDVNMNGVSLLSTPITIDVGEKTSRTANVPPVIGALTAVPDDAEFTFDIDVAGTGARGAKIWLFGTRTVL